jgi:hypothetical protein
MEPDTKHRDSKRCPYCAEIIQAEAIKCKHCGSELLKTETRATPEITVTSKELLQKAYDRYDKIDIDGALDLLKKIILDDPNSTEAEAAKTKIKKIFSAKEFYGKAYDLHSKANDLGLYKVLIEVFPESPQADYAKQQVKNIENSKGQQKENPTT